MPEGLSAAEVGKEIAEHKKHAAAAPMKAASATAGCRSSRRVLLSLVAVLAAYSGYAAAKWGTESSVTLAKASAERTKASRASLEGDRDPHARLGLVQCLVHGLHGRATPARSGWRNRRMRPGYRPAFNAWLATDPAHNPNAPAGPAYMPQYVIPQEAAAKAHDAQADAAFAKGAKAGSTADKYIRDTVFLATVLFLVGISRPLPGAPGAPGPLAVGGCLLVFAVIQLLGLPGPPA